MTSVLPPSVIQCVDNPHVRDAEAYPDALNLILAATDLDDARRQVTSWPGYGPTPLRALSGLARAAGLADILYKDESERFGIGSFKPLGGGYALYRVLANEIAKTGRPVPDSRAILQGAERQLVSDITVTAATDGNHGRAVAWAARMFGCRCVIFIHETVTTGREKAIAFYGAEVRRVPGTFDDAVRAAEETAQYEGWHVIPDTAAGGTVEAPNNVMRGYMLSADEAIGQMPPDQPPSHVFVQAGVGGLAAATCARFWQVFGVRRPRLVVVEPQSADCWFKSLTAGTPVVAEGDLHSIMAGLACGEVSPLAWPVLSEGAHHAITITDQAAADTMRLLASGRHGERPLVAGESAVAGLAALLLAAADPQLRRRLALDENSRVYVVASEGDTDAETYRAIVGESGDQVRERERTS